MLLRHAIVTILCVSASSGMSQSTLSFDYDFLGRLIDTQYSAGPDTLYTYDPADNRLSVVVSGVAAPGAPQSGQQATASPQSSPDPICSPVSGCAGE